MVITSMETSAMTGIVATLNLVLFLPLQQTAYHLLPQFSMSRVYTITVMVTLLARTENRNIMNDKTWASVPLSSVKFQKFQPKTDTTLSVGVTTTVHQYTDQNNADSKDFELDPIADQKSSMVEEV